PPKPSRYSRFTQAVDIETVRWFHLLDTLTIYWIPGGSPVKISRRTIGLAAVASLAVTIPLVLNHGANASTTPNATASGSYTAAQVLAGVKKNMTSSKQVNTKPHINTMTRAMNVNVYQVSSGVYAYTSSLAVDDDG